MIESAVELEDLVARFDAGTSPRAEWTHLSHLAVGLWHVHQYGADEGLVRMRARIRRLNDIHGTPNSPTSGYHETITRAYTCLLADFVSGLPEGAPLLESWARLIRGPERTLLHTRNRRPGIRR